MAGPKEDLETLFARRREIDRALLEEHSREVAILFTDIVGSTTFFETKGDIAGLELVRRHNALLFPIVEANGGWIVKTIGDAIMAVFPQAEQAVTCGVQMQRALAEENERGTADPIHIRVGAHFGRALVEEGKDVYGDTVNLAARVVHETRGDEILVSRGLADRLPPAAGFLLAPRGSFQPKGKAEAVPVVSVEWREDVVERVKSAENLIPANVPLPAVAPAKSKEIFVLEVQTGTKGLKVAALDGAADKGTVKAYSDVAVTPARLDAMAEQFDTFMRASGGRSYVDRVRELGDTLFKTTLSDRAKRHVSETALRFLRLHLDDQLVHVPWELMHDGREFLALRFAMGRVVSARAETSPGARVPAEHVTHALVVSNPSGDLQHAVREGEAVAGLLRDGYLGEVRHVRGPLKRIELLDALRGCAVLHFAGHAEQPTKTTPGGFRVADGIVTAEEVARAVGAAAPALVFANGCHTSSAAAFRGSDESAPDLASALLLRGSRHFIGPRWEIADSDALTFALRFYERALRGIEFGEAVRLARRDLTGPEARPLSFAGYVLYGEPRGGFSQTLIRVTGETQVRSGGSHDALPAVQAPRIAPAANAPATVLTPSDSQPMKMISGPPKSRRGVLAFAGVAGALALVGVGGFLAMRGHDGAGTQPVTNANMHEVTAAPTGSTGAVGTSGPSDPIRGATTDTSPPRAGETTPANEAATGATPAPATGPVRLCVLPFKNISGDKDLDFLRDGMTEAVMTDFGESKGVKLIERAQIDLDIQELEFSQSKYVDPGTRSKIGQIHGAEVVLMGGFQRAGTTVRAHARFVDVETGEVLRAVKVEKALTKKNPNALFELQDDLSEQVRASVPTVVERLRP